MPPVRRSSIGIDAVYDPSRLTTEQWVASGATSRASSTAATGLWSDLSEATPLASPVMRISSMAASVSNGTYAPDVAAEFIYQFTPGPRPELATDPDAWTEEDERVAAAHFAHLQAAAEKGRVILAGRSQDGTGPAIVVFRADTDEEARRFMEDDPFVSEGLFGASLHPFRAALVDRPG